MKSQIHPIFKGEADDYFICSGSFEKRCHCVPSRLSISDYQAKHYVIIRYSGKDDKKEENIKLIYNYLSEKNNVNIISIETFNIDDLCEFSEYLIDLCKNANNAKAITIDITTFTKKYLLVMLYILRKEIPKAAIRLLYTPGIYKVPKYSTPQSHLSWGVRNISLVPYFGGMSALESNKKLLVLLLGYERERAWAVYNHIEPDKIIAVIANPPTYSGYDYPSLIANKRILKLSITEKEYVSARKPLDTTSLLTKLYKMPSYQDYMLYISPLGTKMETVGIYMFFEENYPVDRAQIIYASPVIYNSDKYTFNYEGEILEYRLPKCLDK